MSDKWTRLARGMDCQIRLPGCMVNQDTVVACHYRMVGMCGVGMKPPSLLCAWGCYRCHSIADGREKLEGWTKEAIRLYHAEGCLRTINELIQRGKLK